MFPTTPPASSPKLPGQAKFWTPKLNEIDEEGFGCFRDVWRIVRVPRRDAVDLIKEEERIAHAVGQVAEDEQEFDELARAVEDQDASDIDSNSSRFNIVRGLIIQDDPSPLEGLELGVAGLVYAIAAAGMFPAASCRGHCGQCAWSRGPVVLFAADRYRAEILQPLVEECECSFVVDEARPELLVVEGASILAMMGLAVAIIDGLQSFKRPRTSVRRDKARVGSQQPMLF